MANFPFAEIRTPGNGVRRKVPQLFHTSSIRNPEPMLNPADVEARIERFPHQCRDAGLKVTHQRIAIYGMLVSTGRHPTPEEVYSEIRTQLPSISLATVYKVLDQFCQHGFLRKVLTETQVARYDANLSPHHHLVCSACGTILDVKTEGVMEGLSVSAENGFRVSHYDVIFHGQCAACLETSRP